MTLCFSLTAFTILSSSWASGILSMLCHGEALLCFWLLRVLHASLICMLDSFPQVESFRPLLIILVNLKLVFFALSSCPLALFEVPLRQPHLLASVLLVAHSLSKLLDS